MARNVQKVFKDDEYRREPAWSPDGKHIAYAQADKRKTIFAFGARFAPTAEHTLYIATPNGTSIEKLTKGFEPSWSPEWDSTHLCSSWAQTHSFGTFRFTDTHPRSTPSRGVALDDFTALVSTSEQDRLR